MATTGEETIKNHLLHMYSINMYVQTHETGLAVLSEDIDVNY